MSLLQAEQQQQQRERAAARTAEAAERAARGAARELERERERLWERADRERREFGGCYAAVLEALLQPLPKPVRGAFQLEI